MTEPQNELIGALLDILYELRDTAIRPTVVGGLAIYLRAHNVFEKEAQTLLPLAVARATQDIDMILSPETILAPHLRLSFQGMLDRLGFGVITKYAYWQYKRHYYRHEQKLDLHTWIPTNTVEEAFRVVDEKLQSLDAKAGLDAHIASEAIGAEKLAMKLRCSGYRNEGTFYQCDVSVPHPFTLMVMKLIAYHDYELKISIAGKTAGEASRNLKYAQKHALDIYVLLSTITEDEWHQAKDYVLVYREAAAVQHAKNIVRDSFSNINAPGMLRMRTSLDSTPGMQFDVIPELLAELFGID